MLFSRERARKKVNNFNSCSIRSFYSTLLTFTFIIIIIIIIIIIVIIIMMIIMIINFMSFSFASKGFFFAGQETRDPNCVQTNYKKRRI